MGATSKLAIPYVDPGNWLADFPVAGDKAQAQKVEDLLLTVPAWGEFRLTSDQAIASGSITAVNLTATFNFGGFTVSGGEITVTQGGLYQVSGLVTFAGVGSGATGNRYGYFHLNSTTVVRSSAPTANGVPLSVPLAKLLNIPAGGKLKLSAYHTQGASLSLDSSNVQNYLTLAKIAEYT